MFNLKIDEELYLRNIHPDDAEALFELLEQNRARLRPWIHPSSLPETAKATRLFTIHCLFNYYGDPTGPSELDQYYPELESYFPPAHRADSATREFSSFFFSSALFWIVTCEAVHLASSSESKRSILASILA